SFSARTASSVRGQIQKRSPAMKTSSFSPDLRDALSSDDQFALPRFTICSADSVAFGPPPAALDSRELEPRGPQPATKKIATARASSSFRRIIMGRLLLAPHGTCAKLNQIIPSIP